MSSSKRTLAANFGALSVVQLANYVIPLLILPYLVRVVGPAKFGVLAFAQAVVFYFNLLPDLGTNLYAPREIALLKNDHEKLSCFVSDVLNLKIIMLLLAIILYILTVMAVPKFRDEKLVFLFSAGYLLGGSLMPVWFFQGIEKMANITLGMLTARLCSLVFVFMLVRDPQDYIYVPLINSGGMLAGSILMYIVMFRTEKIRFSLGGRASKVAIIKDSFALFVSNVAISVYTGINTVVLGFLTTDLIVGYYAAAEKLVKAGLALQGQVATVFYPHISARFQESRSAGELAIRHGLVVTMLVAIPATIFTVAYAPFVVEIMLGQDFMQSILPLQIMGLLFFVIGLSNVFGIQVFLPLGMKKEVMWPTLWAGIFNLLLLFVLVPGWSSAGAAAAFLLAEVAVTTWMFIRIRKVDLQLVSRATVSRLLTLAVLLIAYAALVVRFTPNSWIQLIGFLIIYPGLILGLKIVDVHTRSINV